MNAPRTRHRIVAFLLTILAGGPALAGKLASRTVKLRLTAPGWDAANDWSAQGLNEAATLRPHLPVYTTTANSWAVRSRCCSSSSCLPWIRDCLFVYR